MNEIIHESDLDDNEREAQLAAILKEVAEKEERNARQHKQLLDLRQKLAESQFELQRHQEWKEVWEPRYKIN